MSNNIKFTSNYTFQICYPTKVVVALLYYIYFNELKYYLLINENLIFISYVLFKRGRQILKK